MDENEKARLREVGNQFVARGRVLVKRLEGGEGCAAEVAELEQFAHDLKCEPMDVELCSEIGDLLCEFAKTALKQPQDAKEEIVRLVRRQLFMGSVDRWRSDRNDYHCLEHERMAEMRDALVSLAQMETLSQAAHEDVIQAYFAFCKSVGLRQAEYKTLVPELLNIAERKSLVEETYVEAAQLLYALTCVVEGVLIRVQLGRHYYSHVFGHVVAFLFHPCVNVVSEAMDVLEAFTNCHPSKVGILNQSTNVLELLVWLMNGYPPFMLCKPTSCASFASAIPSTSTSSTTSIQSESQSSVSMPSAFPASSSEFYSLQKKFQELPALSMDAADYPPISSPFPPRHPKFCQWPSECIESPLYPADERDEWLHTSASDRLVMNTINVIDSLFRFASRESAREHVVGEIGVEEEQSQSSIGRKEECVDGAAIGRRGKSEVNEAKEGSGCEMKRRKRKGKAKDCEVADGRMEECGRGPVNGRYYAVVFCTDGFVAALTRLFEQKRVMACYSYLLFTIFCSVLEDGSDRDVVEWIGQTRFMEMAASHLFDERVFLQDNGCFVFVEMLWEVLLSRRRRAMKEISSAMEEERLKVREKEGHNRTAQERQANKKMRKRGSSSHNSKGDGSGGSGEEDEESQQVEKRGRKHSNSNAKGKRVKDQQQEKERQRAERNEKKAEMEQARRRKKEKKEMRIKRKALEVCVWSMDLLEEEGMDDLVVMVRHVMVELL
ncbi:uncharacterized protein MONOS_7646 [Monocercomonoides exilis]|uniref:uncharacterized protein n=1 Tax=Monocercomonoides exilis TaxID=2049356 RepID=UPI00355A68FF|nr:hypothetical protein MONOS_7646 [Monocercomonoides exilis]|eukprot:MONOS_7646.1-p1 / transcript=MONOS_7646.1 / gene=MONOS_7646 / organism=Monocercomonoides_exilis_PA203 / gene_product=unspecified product / transcript_product=unspecified product / location=Mono_scaffold00267:5997-8527(+) / protein_length=721 / sequence_SO=supercontig / SO=protein_coding / is_pseudo=false